MVSATARPYAGRGGIATGSYTHGNRKGPRFFIRRYVNSSSSPGAGPRFRRGHRSVIINPVVGVRFRAVARENFFMSRPFRVGISALAFAGFAVVFAAVQPKDDKAPLPPAPKGFPHEEEDPLSPGVVKKIDPDEDAADVTVPRGAAYFKLGPIARRVANTADLDLKQLFKTYSVAFDRIVEGDGTRTRVCPLPRHRDQTYPTRFGAFVFTDSNVPSPLARAFEMGRINGIRHFEDLAIDQARDLLKPAPATGATGLEKLPAGVRAEAAEAILTETLFFTSAAADQGKRKGPGWDGLRKKVADELAATRAARLKIAVADKDWALARTLGARMIATYGETPERLEEVYSAKLAEAEAVLEGAGERPTELERVHLALAEYEAKSPGPTRPAWPRCGANSPNSRRSNSNGPTTSSPATPPPRAGSSRT